MLTVAWFVVLSASTVWALHRARCATARDRLRALHPPRLPARLRPVEDRIRAAVAAAGYDIDAAGALTVWMAATATLVVLTLALVPPLWPFAIATGIASGPVALAAGRRRVARAIVAAAPGVLETAAHHLRSGGTVGGAIEEMARAGASALAPDCRRVVARVRVGVRLSDALAMWARDRPTVEVRSVAGALGIAAAMGGRSAVALDGLAAGLRDRAAVAAELRALSTQATLSATIVGAAPLGFLAFSTAIGGDELHVLTTRPIGRICLATGLALDALAVVWMRRIVAARR